MSNSIMDFIEENYETLLTFAVRITGNWADANRHIYSSIDDDGTYSVVRVLDDSIFSVYSYADYSIKELVKMVEDY